MKTRTYRVGLHSLTVTEQNGVISSQLNGTDPVVYDSIREAAVSIGETVGGWIAKALLVEAASEGLNIWEGVKNENTKISNQ